MKLRSNVFERRLRRRVLDAIGASRSLWDEHGRVRKYRRPARLVRFGRCSASLMLGILTWRATAATGHAATGLAVIALWMLGATAVPMDFRANATERSQLAKEFDLAAIIEDRQIEAPGYEHVHVDAGWSEVVARHDADPIFPGEKQAVAAFISLTSGTTGRPKGIVIDHERMLLRSAFDASERLSGTMLDPLPLSFSASRTHAFAALRTDYEKTGRGELFAALGPLAWGNATDTALAPVALKLGLTTHTCTVALHRLRRRLGDFRPRQCRGHGRGALAGARKAADIPRA